MTIKSLSISAILLFILLLSQSALAGQAICNQFSDSRIVCQNYDDSGNYQGQNYMQRNGNSNTWGSVSDDRGDN
jgi:hypothetical protein